MSKQGTQVVEERPRNRQQLRPSWARVSRRDYGRNHAGKGRLR